MPQLYKSTVVTHSIINPSSFRVIKCPKFIEKIIFINKINLPNELIRLIKDFLCYSELEVIQRHHKIMIGLTIKELCLNRGIEASATDEECRVNTLIRSHHYNDSFSSYLRTCAICGNCENNHNGIPLGYCLESNSNNLNSNLIPISYISERNGIVRNSVFYSSTELTYFSTNQNEEDYYFPTYLNDEDYDLYYDSEGYWN